MSTMTDTLSHTLLERQGSSVQAQISTDFVVNGESLLQILLNADGGHSDYMGRFVAGLPKVNKSAADELLARIPSEAGDGRSLLYMCPECGDIGCGAYAARIQRDADKFAWFDFVYLNGYEAPRPLPNVGPFAFTVPEYEHAIAAASSI